MKILSLVVILAYVYGSSAAANRSTMWLLADELVYSYNKNYQACTSRIGATANTSLLTTSYYRITTGATADKVYDSLPGGAGGTSDLLYILQSLQLIFIYGDSVTPNIVFTLPVFTAMTPALANSYFTQITNSIPPGTYVSASGAAWLSVQVVYSTSTPSAPVNYPAQSTLNTGAFALGSISAATVLITDYRSRSTFAIMQYQDGNGDNADDTYNHLYSIIVRTPSSLITTSSSDILVGGCTAAATRAGTAVAVKLATSCATSVAGATDTSLSSSSGCTDTKMADALNLAVAGMQALRTVDNAVFSTGSSKFTYTANFGILIGMSSVIFSFLY